VDQRDVTIYRLSQSKTLPLVGDHGLIVTEELEAEGGVCYVKDGPFRLVGLGDA
jgi:hypothetical protein